MRQGQLRAASGDFACRHFETRFNRVGQFSNSFKKLQKQYIDDDQHVVDLLNGNLTIFEELVPGAEEYFEEKEAL